MRLLAQKRDDIRAKMHGLMPGKFKKHRGNKTLAVKIYPEASLTVFKVVNFYPVESQKLQK
ncbi:hypothetical protein CSC3H3_18010 [Thalassospira marina]|uniref:Uncharacterized protein n=1 Tax=Thalassospira marina TaxID=2048283 RepID=A0ABM6QDL1_9PROT|nr:hypothetical protein CSC3H3_18010 [Thalassospira marina]